MWPRSLACSPVKAWSCSKALHILTREGKINQDSRRKLKQVYHLYQFIAPILQELERQRPPRHPGRPRRGQVLPGLHPVRPVFQAPGPGQHLRHRNPRRHWCRPRSNWRRDLGFDRACSFLNMSVAESTPQADFMPERFDIVTALHACDTATDDAIAFGLEKQARALVLVPCCQAEVAAAMRQNQSPAPGAHPAGRAVAPPHPHARNRQPPDQRAALPVPGSLRLPSDGDRAGGLGAQHEKRADHRAATPARKNAAPPSACASCWSNLACKRRWRTAIRPCPPSE